MVREGSPTNAAPPTTPLRRTQMLTPKQVCRLLGLRVHWPTRGPSRMETAVAMAREGFTAEEVRRMLSVRRRTRDEAAISRIVELIARENMEGNR